MLLFQSFASKKAQEQVFQNGLKDCTGLPTSNKVYNPEAVKLFANAVGLMYPQKKPANPFI